jgi:hypothetical protein
MRFMVKDAPVPPATVPTAPASSASHTSERSPGVPLLLMPLGVKRKSRLPSAYAVRVPGVVHWATKRSDGVNERENCCNGLARFSTVGRGREARCSTTSSTLYITQITHGVVHTCATNAHYCTDLPVPPRCGR